MSAPKSKDKIIDLGRDTGSAVWGKAIADLLAHRVEGLSYRLPHWDKDRDLLVLFSRCFMVRDESVSSKCL